MGSKRRPNRWDFSPASPSGTVQLRQFLLLSSVCGRFLLYLFMVCGWNVIQLRHPMDARSLEQVCRHPPKPSITLPPTGARIDRPECYGRGFAQLIRNCRFRPIVPSRCRASACTERRVRWCVTAPVCGRTHGGGAGEQLALGTSSAFGSQYVMHRFLGDGAGDWAGKV